MSAGEKRSGRRERPETDIVGQRRGRVRSRMRVINRPEHHRAFAQQNLPPFCGEETTPHRRRKPQRDAFARNFPVIGRDPGRAKLLAETHARTRLRARRSKKYRNKRELARKMTPASKIEARRGASAPRAELRNPGFAGLVFQACETSQSAGLLVCLNPAKA